MKHIFHPLKINAKIPQAAKATKACAEERDAAVALKGLLKDREASLLQAEADATEAARKTREAVEESDRREQAQK